MPNPKKVQEVEELAGKLSSCSIAISTQVRGISATELTRFRRELRGRGLEYRVIKNTLVKLAADQIGKPELTSIIEGPTALALSSGEATEAARALLDCVRSSRLNVIILGAILDSRALTTGEVQALATIPPRPVLLAQFQGQLLAPIQSLVSTLSASMAALARALQARAQQLESSNK